MLAQIDFGVLTWEAVPSGQLLNRHSCTSRLGASTSRYLPWSDATTSLSLTATDGYHCCSVATHALSRQGHVQSVPCTLSAPASSAAAAVQGGAT
jgi:hypothetical protein